MAVICGSLGPADKGVKRWNFKCHFFMMTFPHQLVKHVSVEQI